MNKTELLKKVGFSEDFLKKIETSKINEFNDVLPASYEVEDFHINTSETTDYDLVFSTPKNLKITHF